MAGSVQIPFGKLTRLVISKAKKKGIKIKILNPLIETKDRPTLCWEESINSQRLIGILIRKEAIEWLNTKIQTRKKWYGIQDIKNAIQLPYNCRKWHTILNKDLEGAKNLVNGLKYEHKKIKGNNGKRERAPFGIMVHGTGKAISRRETKQG